MIQLRSPRPLDGRQEIIHRGRLNSVRRTDVTLPQPALAEIAYGIARLPKSKRRNWLEERRDLLTATMAQSEWTAAVTAAFGQIKATLARRGEPIEDMDTAIAAHALATEAVLVMADRTHMTRIPGVNIEDGPRS